MPSIYLFKTNFHTHDILVFMLGWRWKLMNETDRGMPHLGEPSTFQLTQRSCTWHCSVQLSLPFPSSFLYLANIYSSSERNLYQLYETFLLVSRGIVLNYSCFPIILCTYLHESSNNALTMFIGVLDAVALKFPDLSYCKFIHLVH